MSRQRAGRATGALACAALLAGAFAQPSAAQTPLAAVRVAPDVTVNLSGTVAGHNQVAEDDLAGAVALVNAGAIPATAIVTAYDRLDDGDQLLSFDTTVVLAGGLTVRPGDVVRYDGAVFTLLFDAAAAGLPRGVVTDAVAAIGPSDLLLSFDVTVALDGVTAADRDVLRIQNGAVSLLFDADAAGVPAGMDLDALHCIRQNGHLLLSFDVSGVLGGVAFDDEDVLEYTPAAGTFALAYDGDSEHAGWNGADLQALAATSDPPATVVAPAIGPPATDPPGQNTVAPGSTRVSGRGTARAKPGDTCIQIWEIGADGELDAPPGSLDDTLLGSGGTDTDGNFVAADGSFGIPVASPLRTGQRLVALDVCADRASAVVNVTTVAAPLLDGLPLLAIAALLLLLGTLTLRRAVPSG